MMLAPVPHLLTADRDQVVQPNKTVLPPPVDASPLNLPRDNESNTPQESSSQGPLDITPSRPEPVHRLTEETMSSINSDDSISRTPRSALRRSSSGSAKDITSPRRVRFDVEGEEVLPTVSPPVSPRIDELLISPPDNPVSPIHESLNHIAAGGDASILGNSPPRPKKISSTERLKALARNSTEDTSKWTVVGDIHDDDEEEDGLVMLSSKKKSHASALEPVPTTALKNGISSDRVETEQSKDLTKNAHSNHPLIDDEMADDVLVMTPLSSFKDKKRFSPPKQQPQQKITTSPDMTPTSQSSLQNKTNSPKSALLSQPRGDENLEEEDMFDFDDESTSQSQPTRTTSKYIQEDEEEDIEVGIDRRDAAPTDSADEKPPITLYSTSPAIPIAKPASSTPESPPSSHPKLVSASVGSYKGKPFMIGVVRDEEILKKATELGNFSTFVGSVDGRSGVDASDSYRREAYSFTGTPRSLGEKLMEEAYAARRLAGNVRKQD
ncbi:hypothetical protein NPX13_g5700 [Xylaria arbuscula]|uniref:Uncharacterized protein n=1 Tax=Xylaria arbuscula TaxID=114810 RepID=A0A9W8TM55_9PEZI|nr:hypothetical protein NPX13_g5700 [Xylaria arbuscula]